MVLVEPGIWDNYKGQKNMGKINGTIFNAKEVNVQYSSMSLSQFSEMRRMDIVLSRVVNLGELDNKEQVLIVEPHPLAPEFNAAWKKRRAERDQPLPALTTADAVRRSVPAGSSSRDLLKLPSPSNVLVLDDRRLPRKASNDGDMGSSPLKLDYCGPTNSGITRDRFVELTKHGCCICSGDIALTQDASRRVSWLDNAPVCWTCAHDAKNIEQYNLPKPGGIIH
jgi:hypothetical protein